MNYDSMTHCPFTIKYNDDGSIICTFVKDINVGDTVNLSKARGCFNTEALGMVWKVDEVIEKRSAVGGGDFTKVKMVLYKRLVNKGDNN